MAAIGPSNIPRSMCLSSIGTELRVTCQPWYSSRPCRAVELPRSFAPGPQICPGWFLDAPKLVPKGWAPHDCDHRGRYELSACAGSGQAVCGDARLRFYRYSSQQRSHRVMALAAAIPPLSLIVTFVK